MQTSFLSLLLTSLTLSSEVLALGDKNGFELVKRVRLPEWPGQTAELFGESHGEHFDYQIVMSNPENRMTGIVMTGCGEHEHLTSMKINVDTVDSKVLNDRSYKDGGFLHGKSKGQSVTLSLDLGQYITKVVLTTYKAKTGFFHMSRRTRIGSISFTKDNGNVVSCGSKSEADARRTWKFGGYKLQYFFGYSGDALDALGAVFKKA